MAADTAALYRSFICKTGILYVILASTTVVAQSRDCNRNCLSNTLDVYLSAVIGHDPVAAPLFIGFRQTENAIVVPPGGGMWRSATGLGKVQRRYFDPLTGQAAYFGIVMEGASAAIVTVRIEVQRGEITEAEWYIGRQGDPGINGPAAPGEQGSNLFDLDNLIAYPPPERTVPVSERLSRDALIAVTNSYFDGITSHNGDIIMAHSGCVRIENGFQTTGRPLPADRLDDGHEGKGDCTSGMSGFSIALVAARRYPLVDEEAQVVLGAAVFLRE
ncbi:MAG: hypothetical protein HW386_957, partial [Gammaproteobacteria bacterium]|nr:hypothetical protein [Gammaproteobacteria bacterium]